MQRTDTLISESVPSTSLPFGEYCTTTRRIVIVSPFPLSLNELIRELTADCYDVLVFHHMDNEALTKLPMDVLIMDLTKDQAADITAADVTVPKGVPALFLLNPDERIADQERTLHWPMPTKPLLERLETVLLKQSESIRKQTSSFLLVYKDLQLDLKRMTCFRGPARVELTKTEFDLLRTLIEAGGAVLSRQNLMDRIWGENYFGGSNTIDVHMKSLRQKLKDNPKAPMYIETVRGIGYRLSVDENGFS